MEAVILSGGLGTRLRPLTYTRPKPLLPVANKPMLEHLLDRLPDEVDRAVLASGYRIDQIRAWAGNLDHRVELVVVDEEEPLGTGGAIANVSEHITGEFLCFNGDVISSAPLEAMIEARREADALGALALWPVEDPSPFGVVAREGRRITRFVEKPEPDQAPSNLINAGTYCFSEAILDHIETGRKVSLEHEVFPSVLDEGRTLLGIPFEGYWVDCGRPDVYLEAHEVLLDGEAALADGARLDGEWAGWVCLGEGAQVDAGARVERSVLYPGARVRSGARLRSTILGEDVEVGKDAVLEGCVVADGETIEAGTELDGEPVGVDPERPVGGTDDEED